MPRSLPPVTLRTGDLLLRPWRPGDADAVYRLCQDPGVQRWTAVPSPYLRSEAETYVAATSPQAWARGTAAHFAVCDAATGDVLGSMSLMWRHGDADIAEIGYWCGAHARGRGVTTAAGREVCRWAFEACAPRRIEWLAEVGNEASWRVAHQIGFRFEGRIRQRLSSAAGTVDAWQGALLPGEVATERVPLPFGVDPVLIDGPVTVRRWREADVDAYHELGNEPSVQTWGGGVRTVEEDRDRLVYRYPEGWMTGHGAAFAVLAGGQIAGSINVGRSNGQAALLGWWLGAAYRGQGVATRALRLATSWAMVAGFARLEARIHVENAASQRLAERVGFVQEGRMRAESPRGDGWGDGYLYALLSG